MALGATFEIVPLKVPLIGALSPDATAFALPYSPAFTRQQSLYGPAFTAVTFQRNVACRPGEAFRQAIGCGIRRGNFGGLSEREFPELAAALRLWGRG